MTSSRLTWVERASIAIGALLVLSGGVRLLRMEMHQRSARRTLAVESSAPHAPSPAAEPHQRPVEGATLGQLEIPRLGVSVIVSEGDGLDDLDLAAGHLPDTPLPWEPGNSAIAAHRDTFFRPLRSIALRDAIRLQTAQGTLDYQVTRVQIVAPDDLSVLAPTDEPSITLITCYPFYYVGHAPKRFIVHAQQVDGLRAVQFFKHPG